MILLEIFVDENAAEKDNVIERALKKLDTLPADYDMLLKEHKLLHEKWYRSAELSLGYEGEFHCNEELLLDAYQGKQSLELIEKLWRYGRYLFPRAMSQGDMPACQFGECREASPSSALLTFYPTSRIMMKPDPAWGERIHVTGDWYHPDETAKKAYINR